MTLRERIEARLALAEAATPGPWGVGAEGSEGSRVNPRTGDIRNDSRHVVSCNGRTQPEDGRNAAFIADRSPDRIIAECRADLTLLDAIRARNRQVRLGINGVDLAILAAANLDNRYPEGEDA